RGSLDAIITAALEEHPGRAHEKVLEAVERALFRRALRQTHGHQARASDLLGLNRATLRSRLRALGLAVDKVLVDEPGEGPGAAPGPGEDLPAGDGSASGS